MSEEIEIYQAMLDDEFRELLNNDPVLDELEKQKYNPKTSYFELMMAISKVFMIDGVTVSCITPAIWAYLYAIDSPYTNNGEIHEIDTDIVLYILHNGIQKVDKDLIDKADGFCKEHQINPDTAEFDIKNLIYLSFRPLEMLVNQAKTDEKTRFDLDWLTHIVSVVSPLTGKTSDEVIFDTSLCECLYYCIQRAREFDYKNEIRRRNSDEINAEIYQRTMSLGREYWEKNYKH